MDGVAEPGTDELEASIRPISNSRYSRGIPYEATVEIDDPPSGSALVSLTATPSSIAEGESATFTLTHTGGDTAQPLTVDIRVDDPQDFLRGNHWDPAPDIPTQVEFAANALTQTLTLTTPDDQRDLTDGDVSPTATQGMGTSRRRLPAGPHRLGNLRHRVGDRQRHPAGPELGMGFPRLHR